jgi:2,5-diketo-D-gluconate reductase A
VFGFELTPEEMVAIDGLDQNRRVGGDPMDVNGG